jgi:hypothetical protein
MLSKTKFLCAAALSLFYFITTASAQIETSYKKGILEKIKNGHSHVLVKSTTFTHSAEFLDAFKKAWTITRGVDFVKLDNLSQNLVEGDTYFGLGSRITQTSHATFITFHLNLWMPDESTIKKRKKNKYTDDDALADIRIMCDRQSLGLGSIPDPKSHEQPIDFDGGGHIFNWSPGVLKNYLLQLSTAITAEKKIDYTDDITVKTKLPELQHQTLYFPIDAFRESSAFVRDGKFNDTTKILSGYKFNYKIITNEQLNEKITNDKEPFYYAIFLMTGSSKMFGVVQSQTGELIYSRYSKFSFNLKTGDLKDLSKQVGKQ